ncbi:MAG: class I SAM-dependent DNA methyltransferase [Rhodospirillaceae bacterium]|nr:class I SAM-dependent DNA methyltransferase [Rhodospirillaceae bacterium]
MTARAETFITRWAASAAAERANYQLFLSELCDLLDVGRPDPSQADDSRNTYVFERAVTFPEGGTGRIDLYKKGAFVLEAKQGSDRTQQAEFDLAPATAAKPSKKGTATRGTKGWDDAMLRARGQAFAYAQALPAAEGWPPFLIVVDVGHTIELYADFTGMGKHYGPYPDSSSFRIALKDLADSDIRKRLKAVWEDSLSLDPARHAAKVTREIADRLARLAKSLEQTHAPHTVAIFLMRCLFTMFAEDVELLPKASFLNKLKSLKGNAKAFQFTMRELWRAMDRGDDCVALQAKVLKFNGGLFQDADALAVTEEQLGLLIEAAEREWKDVEPAIFGTLLERALDPNERHRLGAHYTPRAYVDRLVLPTIIEPLRADWDAAKAAAVTLANRGDMDGAKDEVKKFHHALCEIRVLDPACGSGNFLYATLEHMKRLEGEVLDFLTNELHEDQSFLELERHSVDPHQFLGLEINERAVHIAELVLWIGYLQWHFRTRGRVLPVEPILRNFHNIQRQDAILAYDAEELARDEHGKPLSRWDGVTFKKHPVTGEDVPDETAQKPIYRYINPRKADWPQADFIIGNPPFIGNKRMRNRLGDGYVDALRASHINVPDSVDLVMYWWDIAATKSKSGLVRRFGLITTNSIRQSLNRKVLQTHIDSPDGLTLTYVIPDHPWIDAADGAAVRVAMTVASSTRGTGRLDQVCRETFGADDYASVELVSKTGRIHADLTVGANLTESAALKANKGLAHQGIIPVSEGFRVSKAEAEEIIRVNPKSADILKPYIIGDDLTERSETRLIIDTFLLSEDVIRREYPVIFQILLDRVKPERDTNSDPKFRDNFWEFGRPRPKMRLQIEQLSRYIGTCRTAKHRVFMFLEHTVIPDAKVIAIGSDDAFLLGCLSSSFHMTWSRNWARLGKGNDQNYNHSECFDKFPFPVCDDETKARIRALGEALDKHRKDRQALHSDLTITGMYNVLEKLRAGVALDAKEKIIHEHGLVSVLKQIHDELDLAVAEAYGWPADLSDDEILTRLVALNHERAAEEKRGLIRWLRPDFQAPTAPGLQADLGMEEAQKKKIAKGKVAKQAWPKTLPDQVQAIRATLTASAAPTGAGDIAKTYTGARTDRIEEVLAALVALGQARKVGERYAA